MKKREKKRSNCGASIHNCQFKVFKEKNSLDDLIFFVSPAKLNFNSNAEPKGVFADQIVLKALLEQWGGLEVRNLLLLLPFFFLLLLS